MERDEIIGYITDTFQNYTAEIDESEYPASIQINIYKDQAEDEDQAEEAKDEDEDEPCNYIEFIIIFVNDNLIKIDHIDNCGDNGIGRIMMDLIDHLAFMINSKAIELIEKSQIIMKTNKKSSMSISLSLLNTLKSGQSWYNSKGYICASLTQEEHNARVAQNTHIIQSTRMDELRINTKLLSEIHEKNEWLDPSINIQSYFTIVANILKNWKDCKYLKLLVKLINDIHALNVVEIDCERHAMIKRLRVAAIVKKKYRKQSRNKKMAKSKNKSKNKRHR